MKAMIFFALGLLAFHNAGAQTCSGTWGTPIVDQTFGQGQAGTLFYGPLSTYAQGVTTSTTFVYTQPADNYSCLVNNANNGQPGGWVHVADHTGDPYGLMFEINAPSFAGSVFVRYTMHDLCPNTTMQLSVWVLNVDKFDGYVGSQQSPNMTFKLVDSVTNAVLDTTVTGPVPFDSAWHQYTMIFNNGNSSIVTLQVINKSLGSGFGNDLALDDISVRPCVPITHIVPKLDTIVNCQSAFIPFTASISGNVYNPPEYQWQYSSDMGTTWINGLPAGNTTTYYFTASALGTYWIRFLTGPVGSGGNSTCSAVSDTSIVTLTATSLPPPSVTSPVIYCQGATATPLTATGTNLSWYTTDTGTIPLPGAPTPSTAVPDSTYYFVTQQSGGCSGSFPDSINVIVKQAPSFTATSNTPICTGATLFLNVSSAIPGIAYIWNGAGGFNATGADQSIPDDTATGTYTVTGSLNGCTVTDTVTAIVSPLPNSAISDTINRQLCTGDTLLLVINNYDATATYKWAPADIFLIPNNNLAQTLVRALQPGYIYLTTTTTLGCVATDSLYLNPQPCCIITFPNAFTPNGDNKNDIFRPITIGHYAAYYLIIVNRWGQTIFATYNEHDGWDGTFNGTPQDVGVYQYFLRYGCNGGQTEEKGDVTLIR